ncbi:hypothetical protein EMMF5_001003 [Cystobasidiomycetes sp. EMM_F5]
MERVGQDYFSSFYDPEVELALQQQYEEQLRQDAVQAMLLYGNSDGLSPMSAFEDDDTITLAEDEAESQADAEAARIVAMLQQQPQQPRLQQVMELRDDASTSFGSTSSTPSDLPSLAHDDEDDEDDSSTDELEHDLEDTLHISALDTYPVIARVDSAATTASASSLGSSHPRTLHRIPADKHHIISSSIPSNAPSSSPLDPSSITIKSTSSSKSKLKRIFGFSQQQKKTSSRAQTVEVEDSRSCVMKSLTRENGQKLVKEKHTSLRTLLTRHIQPQQCTPHHHRATGASKQGLSPPTSSRMSQTDVVVPCLAYGEQ